MGLQALFNTLAFQPFNGNTATGSTSTSEFTTLPAAPTSIKLVRRPSLNAL